MPGGYPGPAKWMNGRVPVRDASGGFTKLGWRLPHGKGAYATSP